MRLVLINITEGHASLFANKNHNNYCGSTTPLTTTYTVCTATRRWSSPPGITQQSSTSLVHPLTAGASARQHYSTYYNLHSLYGHTEVVAITRYNTTVLYLSSPSSDSERVSPPVLLHSLQPTQSVRPHGGGRHHQV